MSDVILAFNCGSSSLKFTLFQLDATDGAPSVLAHGAVETTPDAPRFHATDSNGTVLADQTWTHPDAPTASAPFSLGPLFEWIESHLAGGKIIAVGHRVVHGGPHFIEPVLITPDILAELEKLTPFAPLHQPVTLAPIKVIAAERPSLPQIACFDTGFHHTMPAIAHLLPIPRHYEDVGVRRYGFHGLSYAYIASRLPELDPKLAQGRVIVAHLGSGASLCALKNGKSVETTMGFSALDGLMMGTRCGAIDPGVLLYMMQEEGAGWHTIVDTLYHHSGLLGVSGVAADMRSLREHVAEQTSQAANAREALDLFAYRVVREIGALTALLGGLDGLIFTAGIGEHDAALRSEVCSALRWLGIRLDPDANQQHAPVISTSDSAIIVRVEPTNEELMICRNVLQTAPNLTQQP